MKRTVLLILCTALLLASACTAQPSGSASKEPQAPSAAQTEAPPASAQPAAGAQQHMNIDSIDSECIKNMLVNGNTKRLIVVYLPPSYYTSEKSYPVVYYLHGYGEPVGNYIGNSKNKLNEAMEAGAKEFIFVGVDGGASYYVNSPVTGNWEDYIFEEVIPMIDKKYRTLPEAESRGICGFSMGGFGAINLALKHPDTFSAVYSMSPGLLTEDGLGEAMDSWKSDMSFLRDYSRAFAPNTNAESMGDVPSMDGSEEDNAIIEKWESGFGNLKEKLAAYTALNIPLKAIGFSYGTKDSYSWIPKGTQYFSDLLKENGIENSLYVFDGGHMQPIQSIQELIIPFFNENLVFEDS